MNRRKGGCKWDQHPREFARITNNDKRYNALCNREIFKIVSSTKVEIATRKTGLRPRLVLLSVERESLLGDRCSNFELWLLPPPSFPSCPLYPCIVPRETALSKPGIVERAIERERKSEGDEEEEKNHQIERSFSLNIPPRELRDEILGILRPPLPPHPSLSLCSPICVRST